MKTTSRTPGQQDPLACLHNPRYALGLGLVEPEGRLLSADSVWQGAGGWIVSSGRSTRSKEFGLCHVRPTRPTRVRGKRGPGRSGSYCGTESPKPPTVRAPAVPAWLRWSSTSIEEFGLCHVRPTGSGELCSRKARTGSLVVLSGATPRPAGPGCARRVCMRLSPIHNVSQPELSGFWTGAGSSCLFRCPSSPIRALIGELLVGGDGARD
jgi:hypothetical protein